MLIVAFGYFKERKVLENESTSKFLDAYVFVFTHKKYCAYYVKNFYLFVWPLKKKFVNTLPSTLQVHSK